MNSGATSFHSIIFPIAFLCPSKRRGMHNTGWLITACTVVQAVVKLTSQSNGKGQILTPWGSETPERISMKLGIYNRVARVCPHMQIHVALQQRGWSGRTRDKHVLWFLRCTFLKFFALFFGSRRARKSGPTYDVCPPKDVPFGGVVHTAPHFGDKIPQKPNFGGVNRHFQA